MFASHTFQEDIKDFQVLDPSQASQILEAKEGAILFIGRESCPYCRRFAPKLAAAAKAQQWTVYFLHSQDPNHSAQEIAQLREDYHVPTVPGLLHAKANGVHVRCDSSLTEADIIAFIKQ